MKDKKVSPYRRGADNGIVMGIYLSCMFGAWSCMIYHQTLSLVGMAMLIVLPLLLYLMLRRTFRNFDGKSTFWEIWTEGIMTFIFGAVIAVIAGYVFMRFIRPTYLPDLFNFTAEALKQTAREAPADAAEQYRIMAHNISDMVENGMMPTPIQFLIDTMWFVTFLGSILALLITMLVRSVPLKNKKQKD